MQIGLVCFRRFQALMCLAGIDADDGNAELTQAQGDRRRHPACLDHGALDRSMALQRVVDRRRCAVDPQCADSATFVINDTDVRRFDRQVNSGIMLYGCLLPSGFDNQKVRRSAGPREAATNYTMTHKRVAQMRMAASLRNYHRLSKDLGEDYRLF
jgi:hypothetical protein